MKKELEKRIEELEEEIEEPYIEEKYVIVKSEKLERLKLLYTDMYESI